MQVVAYLKPEKESWSDLGKTSDLMTEIRLAAKGGYKGLNPNYINSLKENVHKSGVISTSEKAANEFRKFCEIHDIEAKGNIIVSLSEKQTFGKDETP